MWIKQQGFQLLLPAKLPNLFVILGQEIFLVERFKQQISAAWSALKKADEVDGALELRRFAINQTQSWESVAAALGNYSLFPSLNVLEVSYDKKNLDAEAKKYLGVYLEQADPSCLLLLDASQLSSSALKFLADDARAALVVVKTPEKNLLERWIAEELRAHYQKFPSNLPALIHQYTQGNLLACSQALEKITLAENQTDCLTQEAAAKHLDDQCIYKLYELSDVCLLGQATQALLILRQALEARQEFSLILWVIAQEIRLLIQLHELTQSQGARCDWKNATQSLKIWPSRSSLYQIALRRLPLDTLKRLLTRCCQLDYQIKSSNNHFLTANFELLVLALCLGREVGPYE